MTGPRPPRDVEIAVLGPMLMRVRGREIALTAPKERALLALLAIRCGHVVSCDEISLALWGDAPPRTAVKAIHGYVSNLRRTLSAGGIETVSPGYRAVIDPDAVDAIRFESLLVGARTDCPDEPATKVETLSAALAIWRGPALGDLANHEIGRNEATRLWELRLQAEEERFDALLDCGRHQTLVPDLMASVDAEPLREARWAQLMLALYRSGRQAEALRTYQRLRTRLATDLGIEPSGRLSTLEVSMLQRRPELDWVPNAVDATTPRRGSTAKATRVPLPAHLGVGPAVGLVGREEELETMGHAFKRVAGGEGLEVLLLSGEAGQGKTTLLAAAARAAFAEGGAYVLFGHSEEDLANPYQLFAEALGHYIAHVGDEELLGQPAVHGPELLPLVPSLAKRVQSQAPVKATGTDAERFLLFASVVDLLATISHETPVVLVFDDLQWADRASLQLLRHLSAAEKPMRVLVIAAYRDSELPRSEALVETLGALRRRRQVTHLAVTGLDDAGVVSLMEAAAGHGLDEAGQRLALAISRETDGNPFFVTEVLLHLVETGAINRDATGRWVPIDSLEGTVLPDSVRQVLDARVLHLGRGADRVLSMAAVIGVDFDLDLLSSATALPMDDLLDVLDAGVAAALLRELPDPLGHFRFTHALIQRTLYEQLGPTRRARAHGTVAASLEALCRGTPEARAGEMARHWSLTGNPADLPRALEAARLAADSALAGLAPAEALRYYSQALDLYARVATVDRRLELDLTTGLGIAQRQTGNPDFRATLLGAAREAAQLGDTHRLVVAALANNRGIVSMIGFLDDEKVEVLQTAIDRLPRDHIDRALALATLCLELTFGSDLERRCALAEEAVDIAARCGDDAITLRVLNLVADPLRVPRLIDQSLARSSDALAMAERVGDPVLHFWAAAARRIAAAMVGDIDEVDRCLEIGGFLASQLDQPTLTWTQTYATADRALLAGDLEEAENLAAEASRIGTENGEPDAAGVFNAQFLSISSQRGTMGDILPLIERAVAYNPGVPTFMSVLAGAHAEAGRLDDARRVLERFEDLRFELPDDMAWVTGMVTYAEAAVECHDPRFAGPLFAQLRPWAGHLSYSDLTTEGPVSHYLGGLATVLGRFEEADGYFAASATFCERVGAKCFGARTELNWARMLLERAGPGDCEHARMLLHKAHAISVQNGYGTTVRRAALALERLG
jgi:DNA-binding SARP family transcriptional activator